MKKKFTLILSLLLTTGMVYDYNFRMAHTNNAGGPPGHTGSPADGQTCARSGCHIGGPALTNETIELSSDVPGTGYVGGTTYNMTLTLIKVGGAKFGFQLSPQNSLGTVLGDLVAGTGSQIVGGDYLTHSFNGTSGSGSRSWDFQWTAPISGSGAVTFYAVGNFANNNGSTDGDVIATESLTINEATGVGLSEAALASLSVYPNPVIDEITVAAKDVDEEIMITMFDVEGRKVLEEKHQGGNIKIDVKSKSLNTGVYFMQIEAGGKSTVKKLLVK
ncbi:MAG: T9SS type A sorting domain-containing protein [Flavobacteriales bacterium]|nr:T9SS type A sorting domain-containing protein [Flavobacteriales bacterium]